jgi:TM2 domain-containing membrane protein YozV
MSEEKSKYCTFCGTMIPYYETYCPSCGEALPVLPGMKKKPEKNVMIAVVLSLIITGLGHVYLGKHRRGAAYFFGTLIIGGVLSLYVSSEQLFILGFIISLIAAYDAYLNAVKVNSYV